MIFEFENMMFVVVVFVCSASCITDAHSSFKWIFPEEQMKRFMCRTLRKDSKDSHKSSFDWSSEIKDWKQSVALEIWFGARRGLVSDDRSPIFGWTILQYSLNLLLQSVCLSMCVYETDEHTNTYWSYQRGCWENQHEALFECPQ